MTIGGGNSPLLTISRTVLSETSSSIANEAEDIIEGGRLMRI
jgi:hypothetical protein